MAHRHTHKKSFSFHKRVAIGDPVPPHSVCVHTWAQVSNQVTYTRQDIQYTHTHTHTHTHHHQCYQFVVKKSSPSHSQVTTYLSSCSMPLSSSLSLSLSLSLSPFPPPHCLYTNFSLFSHSDKRSSESVTSPPTPMRADDMRLPFLILWLWSYNQSLYSD